MTPTEQNTIALIWNTYWIQISTGVTILIFIIGFLWNKGKNKNIIKNTKNENGKVTQIINSNQDNIIDEVDNKNGSITQK